MKTKYKDIRTSDSEVRLPTAKNSKSNHLKNCLLIKASMEVSAEANVEMSVIVSAERAGNEDRGENQGGSVSRDDVVDPPGEDQKKHRVVIISDVSNDLNSLMTSSVKVVENSRHICLLCNYKTKPRTHDGIESLATQRALMERHMQKFHLTAKSSIDQEKGSWKHCPSCEVVFKSHVVFFNGVCLTCYDNVKKADKDTVSGHAERFKQCNQQQQYEPPQIDERAAERIISSQSLSSYKVGDFLVVTNPDFDLTISDEPYVAIMLFYNLKSGKYISRIWNQSVEVGWASRVNELEEACKRLFKQGKPCIGHPLGELENNNTSDDYLASYTPIPRIVSKSCVKLLGRSNLSSDSSCPECEKLAKVDNYLQGPIKTENVSGGTIKVKKEVCEDDFCFDTNEPYISEKEETIVDYAKEDRLSTTKETSKVQESSQIGSITQSFTIQKSNYSAAYFEKITWRKLMPVKNQDQNGGKLCPWCNKVIKSDQLWDRHRRFYHHYGIFSCPVCFFHCHFAKDLLEHMKTEAHNSDVSCPRCKKSFPSPEIESHYVICYTGCPTCKKTFSSWKCYLEHKKYSHKIVSEEEYHCCDRCGKRFSKRKNLKYHISTIHEGKIPTHLKPHSCTICDLPFETYGLMKMHRLQVHFKDQSKIQCQKCGLQLSTYSLKKHMLTHEEAQFKCSFCGKLIKTQSNLEAHERAHRGEKPFQCTLCSSSFTTKKSLGQHLRGAHKIAKGGKVGWYHGKKKRKESDILNSDHGLQ